MEFSTKIVWIFCPFLIALKAQDAYTLHDKDVDIRIFTGATNNLRQHLGKPAIGDVGPKLRSLADKTETIDQKWQSAVQDQGSTLTTSIQTIERSWAQTDIGQLQKSISEATSAFKGVENDVINLRSDAHVVTEAARARSQQIQSEANYLWTSIEANSRMQNNIQDTISRVNLQIDQNVRAAGQLELNANIMNRRAEAQKSQGVAKAVVGILTTPFTLGLSIPQAISGFSDIKSAERAYSTARDLRNSAAAQRNQIPGLQAQVNNYQHEKSRLENELQNKHQELAKVQAFASDVGLVKTDLNTFSDLLNTAVGHLQNFEVAFREMSHTADTMEILQSIMTENCSSAPTSAAIDLCNNQVGNWHGIRDFLGFMKTQKANSHGSIHDEF